VVRNHAPKAIGCRRGGVNLNTSRNPLIIAFAGGLSRHR
jgi:hypothetical protein